MKETNPSNHLDDLTRMHLRAHAVAKEMLRIKWPGKLRAWLNKPMITPLMLLWSLTNAIISVALYIWLFK